MKTNQPTTKLLAAAAALALTLGATNAMAQTETFAGVGLGNSKVSADVKYYDEEYDYSESESFSESDTLFYLRGGAIFNNDIRAYITLSNVTYDVLGSGLDLDQLTLAASADKLFPIDDKMSFYAGGTLGYTSFDPDFGGKETGLLAGIQGGIFYQATPAIGLDAGLSYSITTAEFKEKETYTVGSSTYTDEFKIELDSVLVFKVGVDFMF